MNCPPHVVVAPILSFPANQCHPSPFTTTTEPLIRPPRRRHCRCSRSPAVIRSNHSTISTIIIPVRPPPSTTDTAAARPPTRLAVMPPVWVRWVVFHRDHLRAPAHQVDDNRPPSCTSTSTRLVAFCPPVSSSRCSISSTRWARSHWRKLCRAARVPMTFLTLRRARVEAAAAPCRRLELWCRCSRRPVRRAAVSRPTNASSRQTHRRLIQLYAR